MKHLADHFLFDEELDIAEALCVRALKFCSRMGKPKDSDIPHFRKDISLLASDLNFILGKVMHKREEYEKALNFYFQAVKMNSQNLGA